MPKQIKDGEIIENPWNFLGQYTLGQPIPTGTVIDINIWHDIPPDILSILTVGLRIYATTDISQFEGDINELAVIDVYFDKFMDGRGFSLGRLLRERYGYTGELRAAGYFIRDQLCYLRRCGFNSFAFDDESIDLEAAVKSLDDFSDGYQPSVDEPKPLFARRS